MGQYLSRDDRIYYVILIEPQTVLHIHTSALPLTRELLQQANPFNDRRKDPGVDFFEIMGETFPFLIILSIGPR